MQVGRINYKVCTRPICVKDFDEMVKQNMWTVDLWTHMCKVHTHMCTHTCAHPGQPGQADRKKEGQQLYFIPLRHFSGFSVMCKLINKYLFNAKEYIEPPRTFLYSLYNIFLLHCLKMIKILYPWYTCIYYKLLFCIHHMPAGSYCEVIVMCSCLSAFSLLRYSY